MSVISDRMSAAIDRIGEDLAFTKLGGAAGAVTVRGVVGLTTMGLMFDSVEEMGIPCPLHEVVFKSDSGVVGDLTTGDEFTRDGRSFMVLRTFRPRVAGKVSCVVGYCG
jgi:hypothetical protein